MNQIAIEEIPHHTDSNRFVDCLEGLPQRIFLDSAHRNAMGGRYDIISAAPHYWLEESDPAQLKKNSTAILQAWLDEFRASPMHHQNLPFFGGILGAFNYDYGRVLENQTPDSYKQFQLPTLNAGLYLWAIVSDHLLSKSYLVSHPACNSEQLKDVRTRILALVKQPPGLSQHREPFQLSGEFHSNIDRSDYLQRIAHIKEYIAAGDCYQVNFSQHFQSHYQGDPWLAYQQLQSAAGPYSAFFETPGASILSLSPERFLQLKGQQVETKPIKGTRPRGANELKDRALRQALLTSEKDRAENLMIVDLLRNDLGKVCDIGSITVEELFAIESFSNVHHLVSTIHGTLANRHSCMDLINACSPGGSITGAPKIRAMQIIEELEPHQRSIYCGSIGYLSLCGQADFNIAIRTLLCENNRIHCWAGGGIVADSVAEQEYQECFDKVGVFFKLLQNKKRLHLAGV